MAFYLCGFVGCDSRSQAASIGRSLDSFEFLHPISDNAIFERDSLWWIHFVPKGLGLGVPGDTDEMRNAFRPISGDLIDKIYRMFSSRSDYKIFLIGWEVGDAMFDPEENQHIEIDGIRFPKVLYAIDGLVLSHELYSSHQQKSKFETFGDGYHWIPHGKSQWLSPYGTTPATAG